MPKHYSLDDLGREVARATDAFEKEGSRFADLDERLRDMHARIDRGELQGGGSFGGGGREDPARLGKINAALREALREGKVSTFLNVMTVNPDTGGGFVVFPSVEQAISSVARDLHPFIGETREKVMEEGDAFEEALSLDASGVAWVGETSARTETTTPTLKVARTPLNEIYSMPKISQRLIDDANTNVSRG